MILSLVVSIVGFQAGLDSHFHPFRRKLDLFAQRVIEILEDAGVIQSRSSGKDNYVFAKMRYAKFVLVRILGVVVVLQCCEIALFFFFVSKLDNSIDGTDK